MEMCARCCEDAKIVIILSEGEEIDVCEGCLVHLITKHQGNIHSIINTITEEVIQL